MDDFTRKFRIPTDKDMEIHQILTTVYQALEEKGYLSHRTFGNTYQYYAVVSRDEFKKKTLKSVISKYFNNSYLGVVSSLVKEEEISLSELKELIREVENANK